MGLFKFLKEKFSKKDDKVQIYDSGLKESRDAFTKRLNSLSKKYKKINQEYFDEVEEILISSDCGVNFTFKCLEELGDIIKKEKIDDIDVVNEKLFEIIFEFYSKDLPENNELLFKNKPEVVLICGVNGVGKTTSIAKLAHFYIEKGKKVLLVAGDTFRAGAKEQLTYWADKIGADIVVGKENEDPASVCYSALINDKVKEYDLILIDTAGRLQNKKNLMNELEKIKRIIAKANLELEETFLVIDATTGQNGVIQAREFKEILPISGIIITKMDGTSKGGVILSIKNELNIPVRFIGLGEKMDDFLPFDLEKFIYGLIQNEE